MTTPSSYASLLIVFPVRVLQTVQVNIITIFSPLWTPGDENWDIEKFLNERGDNIKLIDSDDKLLQIQMTDIVGSTSNKKKDDDGRQ